MAFWQFGTPSTALHLQLPTANRQLPDNCSPTTDNYLALITSSDSADRQFRRGGGRSSVGRLLASGARLWRQAAGGGSRSRYAGSNWNPQLPPGRLSKPAESSSLGILRQKADRHAFNLSKASPLCLLLLYAPVAPISFSCPKTARRLSGFGSWSRYASPERKTNQTLSRLR